MDSKTKILIVEHDLWDIELIKFELKKGGIDYVSKVVQSEKDYIDALNNFIPDIILSDYSLPAFDGPSAFRIREELAPGTPFIFVSGAIGEENSVELISSGLTDYALKDKLFTLPVKVKRAIKESVETKQKRKLEQGRTQTAVRLARAQQIAHIGSWELDFDTNVLVLSEEGCRIFGFPLDKNHLSYESWCTLVHPDDIAVVLAIIKEAQEKVKDTSYSHRIICSDGSVKHIYSESKFELNADGKAIGMYGILQDVTERKLAEIQREFDKSNLRSLINNTDDLMWSVDREFKLITFNQPFEDSMRTASAKGLWPGVDVVAVGIATGQMNGYKEFYERAFKGEAFREVEHIYFPVERWLEISFYPIRNGEEVAGSACHSHDIKVRKKAENEIRELNDNLERRIAERTAELTEANKALEAFSYSVSHDLRSPLRAVIGFARIINERQNELPPQIGELFNHIESSSMRMNIIIDDLLTLAKCGRETLKIVPIEMTELFHNIWDKIIYSSPNKVTLELPDLPVAQGDISMMEQVVINLLSNAIKYSS
ncbi:MAG: domain S-box protein, partial [Bacteroidota bacterium]|nr:domain S-box protein [Bacteroidota bacterium]